MKKRFLSLLLALVMMLGLIPVVAPAANAAAASIEIGSVDLYAGYYLEQDSYTPTSIKPADNYAYFNGSTLELHNFIRTSAIVNADFDLVIRLFGYNLVRQVNCNGISDRNYDKYYDLVIDGNGMLSISGSYTGTMIKNLNVKSGNLEIASMEQAFYDSEFDGVTYPNNAIALCSQYEGGTWESFDLDKVKDDKYQHVLIISDAYFGSQSPAMPEGKTEHDLGTVAASNYPISFRAMAADVLGSNGCRQYEMLEVKNSAGQTVIRQIKEADDRDMPFDMNELPAGQYTIEETVGIIDPDGKKQITTTHSFYINWQPMPAVKYVIAKSTEPIAGTVNTAPTITFDSEYHCKVSDYAEGYWLYYTKGLGWRRMDENTKFEAGKDYAYYFAIETTDGYVFPADGGNVNGILQCDQGYFGATVNRVDGRDDVAEMMLSYQPCTYGAPLEFSEQTPVAEFTGGLYEMEAVLGEDYLFSFNNKPLTDAQKAKGFTIERTLMVSVGSLTNFVYKVQNDTGTQPLSYNLTIDQAQTYVVTMAITLKKDGTTLDTKGGVYQIKVVAGGTPVILTADSSKSFGGYATVDINAMAAKDANLKTALQNGTVKYQWYRGASQIPGATGQSYTFHADDVGKKIKVAVLYGNSGSISEPFTVTGTAPAFTTQPTGGDVDPGSTMTVKWATSFTPTKIVVDKYNLVGLASEYTALSGTATSIELPANEYGYVIRAYYNDTDFITSNKFTITEAEPVEDGWQQIDGKWYYYVSGVAQTGWLKDGTKWYYMDENGAMTTGWQKVDGKWYYLNNNMKTGWQQISGKWYYLGSDGAMRTGWQQISSKWYYLGTDGAMKTYWQQISGKWYYLGSDGAMKTGWQKISGKWYYLNSEMKTGWQKISGKWYYLNTEMKTGWQQIGGKWYYLGTDGAMRTGWVQLSGKWYYLNSSGVMVTGTQTIDGKTYKFNSSGVWIG